VHLLQVTEASEDQTHSQGMHTSKDRVVSVSQELLVTISCNSYSYSNCNCNNWLSSAEQPTREPEAHGVHAATCSKLTNVTLPAVHCTEHDA